MAVVAFDAIVIPELANKIETKYENEKKNKIKKNTKGAPMSATLPSLFIVMFFFSFLNFGYSCPIWGSTPHGVLHEKQAQKHQNHQRSKPRSANEQYLQLKQNSCKTNLQYIIKTNNITLIVNTNSCA